MQTDPEPGAVVPTQADQMIPVTREDAVSFCGEAFRNMGIDRISEADLRDITGSLRAFALKRHRLAGISAGRAEPAPIDWQDVRLMAGEGELSAQTVLDACNAVLRSRVGRAGAGGEQKFSLGDRVTKTKGSSWTGRVVGLYSTSLTPVGYAVESENEPGSVQIYPQSALSEVGHDQR